MFGREQAVQSAITTGKMYLQGRAVGILLAACCCLLCADSFLQYRSNTYLSLASSALTWNLAEGFTRGRSYYYEAAAKSMLLKLKLRVPLHSRLPGTSMHFAIECSLRCLAPERPQRLRSIVLTRTNLSHRLKHLSACQQHVRLVGTPSQPWFGGKFCSKKDDLILV
ncbi:unnamed protein product [Laminaria digitata]